MESYEIDFVILWVDGSDPEWQAEYNRYCPIDKRIETRKCQYRDFDLLRYWFRGVERFAPWVHRIYFVTCGQKPAWLNEASPKLRCVNHSEYIGAEYLPVFSSNSIELALHKLPDISEHFVYFNDDFFLTDYVSLDFFFRNGRPNDELILNPLQGNIKSLINHFILESCSIINDKFNLHSCIRKNFTKFFNWHYGVENFRNMLLCIFPNVSSFLNQHFAQPFLKQTFDEVWAEYGDLLLLTQKSRFREASNVNQWLFRYWNLMQGNFNPVDLYHGRHYFTLGTKFDEMCKAIERQSYKEVVINDTGYDISDAELQRLKDAFDTILPEKSSFEL